MKTYKEFTLSENIIGKILTSLESTIEKLVEEYNKINIKDIDKELTNHQKEMIRLYIVFDLVKSIEKYTLPTDTLIKLSSEYSNKGNLTITSKIKRDSVEYSLSTEVIYAGGYNIQKLHYRYITKTNLPQTNRSEITNIINGEIKKMNKVEKIQNDIDILENRIKNNLIKIESNSKMSDDEIYHILITDNKTLGITWEEIGDDAPIKQNSNKEEFIKNQKEYIVREINNWKIKNIEWLRNNNDINKESINKLQVKLNNLYK